MAAMATEEPMAAARAASEPMAALAVRAAVEIEGSGDGGELPCGSDTGAAGESVKNRRGGEGCRGVSGGEGRRSVKSAARAADAGCRQHWRARRGPEGTGDGGHGTDAGGGRQRGRGRRRPWMSRPRPEAAVVIGIEPRTAQDREEDQRWGMGALVLIVKGAGRGRAEELGDPRAPAGEVQWWPRPSRGRRASRGTVKGGDGGSPEGPVEAARVAGGSRGRPDRGQRRP